MEYIKLLKVADVREVLDKLSREEISYSKMVELLNIKANKQLLIQRVSQRSEPLIDIHGYHGDLNGSCLTCGLPEGCHEL